MRKIKCENPICGTTFYFNEKKNPNATKVRCPKCKNIQALPADPSLKEEEEEEDWLRRSPSPSPSSPVMPSSEKAPPPEDREESALKEDFLAPNPRPASTVPPPSVGEKPRTASAKDAGIGWLVVHDEATETATFQLRKGINRIGRHSQSTPRDVNIAIRTKDQYMSREHCDIEVRWQKDKGSYDYALADRRSSNGTFVNAGRRLLRSEEVMLKDGDTIQAGRTKLVLKLPAMANNAQDAEDWVRNSEYTPTIIQ